MVFLNSTTKHSAKSKKIQDLIEEYLHSVVDIEAKLQRMNAPSLFGADIQELTFQAEMQTENRLRFKVR